MIEIFNENCGPRIPKCDPDSLEVAYKKMAATHWSRKPDRAYWKHLICEIAKNDFLTSKANFYWFVSAAKHQKILDGFYAPWGEKAKKPEFTGVEFYAE